MGVKRARKPNLFIRCIKGPIRVLARARDFYVQSLTGAGAHVSYGNSMGCPTPQIPAVPRSFSTNSARRFATPEDELRDLIRLGSSGNMEAELRRSKSAAPALGGGKRGGGSSVAAPPPVPRCRTVAVGIGRIEEETVFEEEDGDGVGLLRGSEKVYPRSRSCAISSRRIRAV